jgi:hypothetical protein
VTLSPLVLTNRKLFFMKDTEAIKDEMINACQQIWDLSVKPEMIKAMKRLKISQIEYVMGVHFFRIADKVFSDTEFEERSFKSKEFIHAFIDPWSERPWYNILQLDIDLRPQTKS